MRWMAKNVVAGELADRCEAQAAYAIGKAKPVGLFIECFGTERVALERIQDAVLLPDGGLRPPMPTTRQSARRAAVTPASASSKTTQAPAGSPSPAAARRNISG